jgi:ankyrin repeat protein
VNAKDGQGETPLFKLAIGSTLGAKKKEALRLLIANKADVNAKAVGSGRTVLATAVHHQNADAIEMLKAAGAQ